MYDDSARPPIILIGMHRSGTSLITQLLAELGLFIGARLDENFEAVAFSELNTWLLASSGGRWDTPTCIEYLLADESGLELACDYLRTRLRFPASIRYLGWQKSLEARSVFEIDCAWGWKDPSNTVTLPVWLKLFPNARVIHIVRNGVDVAESLVTRQRAGFRVAQTRFEKHRWLAPWRAKAGWFGESPRVMEREQAFRLWEEYLDYAERFVHAAKVECLELRYEDFLAESKSNLNQLASFCQLDTEAGQIARASHTVRQARRFGFASDAKLLDFWRTVRTRAHMVRLGYDQLPDGLLPPHAPQREP